MTYYTFKTPDTDEQAEALVNEVPRCKQIIDYVAHWVSWRSSMGDMDGKQVWEEFEKNVTQALKAGLDDTMPN